MRNLWTTFCSTVPRQERFESYLFSLFGTNWGDPRFSVGAISELKECCQQKKEGVAKSSSMLVLDNVDLNLCLSFYFRQLSSETKLSIENGPFTLVGFIDWMVCK